MAATFDTGQTGGAAGTSAPGRFRPWAGRRRGTEARRLTRRASILLGLSSVILLLAAWQAAYALKLVNPLFTGSPGGIARSFWDMVQGDSLGPELELSAEQFALGYLLAVVVGIPLGTLIGWYRPLASFLQPLISLAYATPKIALFPLFIIWLGIGSSSKVLIIFLECVFQILFNTAAGVRTADDNLLRVARSYCASDLRIFRDVALPGAVPFIIAGLRLAVGGGLVAMVFAELYVGNGGIGFEISAAGQNFQTNDLFVGVLIVALTAVVLMGLLQVLERKVDSWRPANG